MDEISMKIVHLSDTHLGFRQLHRVDERGRNQREQDVYQAFDRAIARAVELEPAAVIHAGDLFDSYHPSSAALAVALDGARRLRDAGIPFVVIAGNHSTPRFTAAQHVFAVLERFGGVEMVYSHARIVRMDGLAVHAIPHYNDAATLARELTSARPQTDADFNVLVAHVGLDGLGHVAGSEAGSVTLSGETLQQAGSFDYICLGHLHRYAPARDNAAYSGSLERLSWADDARRKGIVEVDLAAGRRDDAYLKLHPIDIRPQITLPPIDADQTDDLTAALVVAADSEELNKAMVRVTIQNVTTAAFGAIDRRAVDAAFAHTLNLEIEPQLVGGGTSASTPADLRDFLSARTPAGLSAEDFISRAESYMAQAEAELAG